MSTKNVTIGPVQITSVDIASINLALQHLAEQIDTLFGLRGRVLVRDRIRADDPQEDEDVVTRRRLAELAQNAVGSILEDTDSVDFTYDTAGPEITADVRIQMSLVVDVNGVKLEGDELSPGNWKFYGTQGSGTKGWRVVDHGNAAGLADDDHTQYQLRSEENVANGYAGLNSVSRIVAGVIATDDVIVNLATKGLVLKDTQGTPHYWRVTISNIGALVTTDIGTTAP